MFAYCVGHLRLSEDAAYKRIQAARAARQFPALFLALAEGRLHLTAIGLLAPHLDSRNAAELMAAATHQGNAEIREFLARRFPESVPTTTAASVRPVGARTNPSPVTRPAELDLMQLAPEQVAPPVPQSAPEQVEVERPPVAAPAAPGQVAPIQAVELFRLHVTIGKRTRDKLRYAQALLSHAVPSGDVEQVLDRALDALIEKYEKRKFGASTQPPTRLRGWSRQGSQARHVPAPVRRAVWERDQGRCTYVGVSGHRCGERKLLELDHVDPVARGGQATVERMRLRCRSHNQHEAERIFGAAFMKEKREKARKRAAGVHSAPAGPEIRGKEEPPAGGAAPQPAPG
jgi:5-methylcytosine-specific restriction endonuclease McrA